MGNSCKCNDKNNIETEDFGNTLLTLSGQKKKLIEKDINQLLSSRSSSAKKFTEIPLDADDEYGEVNEQRIKSLKKIRINPTQNFEEDFSDKNGPEGPFQSSLRLSKEIIKNKRMIFSVLYTNTKISKKLFINPSEIFITYDTLETLDEKTEVIYDCKMDKFFKDWKNEVYIKIYKTFISILYMNQSLDNKETIQLDEIDSLINLFKKEKKEGPYLSGFKLNLHNEKDMIFMSKNPEIGKAVYEILTFLKWKQSYDKQNIKGKNRQ